MYHDDDLLLTDLYQLSMLQAYLEAGLDGTAVFELFVRRLPPGRDFLVAAGLDQALDYLERLRASPAALDWLARDGRFGAELIEALEGLRFTGDVHAMPEGTVFFPNEPILRVTAPLPEAQLVETRLVNLLHFQSVIASKAARMVLAAGGRRLVDFGFRRAHGAEAGTLAARASYIAGFDGTATVAAGRAFGIPLYGTMAHSFVQCFDEEAAAFEAFASARPDGLTLLIDTYDTLSGASIVAALAPSLEARGIELRAVRIDSGDLAELSVGVRETLDAAGLDAVEIFASGGLDELAIAELVCRGVPIDGFGVGTSLTTAADAPALDCAYKLQEYAGLPRRKTSPGKATWPGRKQVWRRFDDDGRMIADTVDTATSEHAGTSLLVPVMRHGRRLRPRETLSEMRRRTARGLAALPQALRGSGDGSSYAVRVGDDLVRLADEVDRRRAHRSASPRER